MEQEPLTFPTGPKAPGAGAGRRVIGPIPPRDAKGRLKIKPVLGKRIKTNGLGEPLRDPAGQPIEEEYDTRNPVEYMAYEHGQEMADGATKGLTLWQVDMPPEPLCLVYARDEAEAVKVFKREMGIVRFGAEDPKATRVH